MSLIQLRRAAKLLGLDALPTALSIEQLAELQNHDAVSLELSDAAKRSHRPDDLSVALASIGELMFRGDRYRLWTDAMSELAANTSAADFARWLAAQGEQPSQMVAAWFKTQGVGAATEPQPAPASEPQPVAHLPDHAPATSNRDGWPLHKPERFQGYIVPLYRLLRASHTDGKSKPSARDVLEAWRDNQPAEIAKMLPDGFDYYDRQGNTKPVSLQVLQKAIDRMTKPR